MGCSCSACYYPLGNITYIIEKIASCCAMAAIISCIVATLIIMLGVGVGLGYNYCFVNLQVHEVRRSTLHPLRSGDYVDGFAEFQEQLKSSNNARKSKHALKPFTLPVKPTMVVPFKGAEDLILLISKIQEHKKNVTLELIT